MKLRKYLLSGLLLIIIMGAATNIINAQNKGKDDLPLPVQLEEKAMKSLKRGKILLNFESADIRVVAKLMSELTGKNIIMDERVKGKISILSSSEVTPKEAWSMFITALNSYGFDVVDWGKTAKILPIKNAIKEKTKFYSEANVARGEDYLVAILALKNADPNQIANVLKPMTSDVGVITPYAPSKSIMIADQAFNVKRLVKIAKHLDTVKQKQITKTYYLKYADSGEVVKSLEKIYKPKEKDVTVAEFESSNAVLVTATHHQLDEITALIKEMDKFIDNRDKTRKFRVIQLSNANSEEVAKILSEMLKEGEKVERKITRTPTGSNKNSNNKTPSSPNTTKVESTTFVSNKVSADKETNSIILYVTDSEMEVIMPMIAKLDSRRKQVLVTAIIAEVSMKRAKNTGANWQVITDSGFGGAFGGGKSLDAIYQLMASGNFVFGGIGDKNTTINIGGRKTEFPNVFALIQFLNEDNDFNILSTPRVLTLDHKEATMNVGSIIPFATGVKFDSNGQPVITYDYKDVGLTLTVTPHIGQSNKIRLELDQKIQDVTDYIQQNLGAIGYVVPVVSTRNVATTIDLYNNQTVIIGGLVSRRTISSMQKVPLLGDIPILGHAFKNTTKETQRTTLFIFLTPHVVETNQDIDNLKKRYSEYLIDPDTLEKIDRTKINNNAAPAGRKE